MNYISARRTVRTSVAACVLASAGTCHAGRVVIIEGSDPMIGGSIHSIATIAQINYLAKGYTVERLSNATGPVTKADVIQALNNPVNNAIFFCGHGIWTPPSGPFLPGLVLDGAAGAAGVLTPADLPPGLGGIIRHVEFQACGQKLPAWDAAFPNAGVDAWNRSVTVAEAWNDARFGSLSRIPAKSPALNAEDGADRGFPAKATDPRFDAAIRATPTFMFNPPVAELFDKWTELGFTLPPPLGAIFGTRAFNVETTDGVSRLAIKGLTVSAAHVVGEVTPSYPAPVFTLVIDTVAFSSAMANLDTIPGLRAAGKFWITGDTTGLPTNVLLDGAIGVYFGTYTLTPPCPGDINSDGHTNTVDLTILLGNFGASVTPGTSGDVDYSGFVNTADLTILLGSFGC